MGGNLKGGLICEMCYMNSEEIHSYREGVRHRMSGWGVCLLSFVFCLLSFVFCLLPFVFCLASSACRPHSAWLFWNHSWYRQA